MTSMAYFDPSISNGTCWSTRDEQSDDIYIPCGNAAIGHRSCCQARDVCLSSGACYNAGCRQKRQTTSTRELTSTQGGVTYIAGCTDQEYSDPLVCPNKGDHTSQQWVGLVRCFISNDTNARNEEWVGCQDTGQPRVTSPDDCVCNTGVHTPAFTDGPVLTNTASLPVSVSDAIAWYSGYEPSNTDLISSQNTAQSGHHTSSQQSSSSLSTAPSISSDEASSSLSTSNAAMNNTEDSTSPYLGQSTIIGIGVGVGLGGFILLCMIIFAIRYFRRRRVDQSIVPFPVMEQIRPRSQIDPAFHIQNGGDVDIDDTELRSPAWSGHKSELAADEVTILDAVRSEGVSDASMLYRAFNPFSTHSSHQGYSRSSTIENQSSNTSAKYHSRNRGDRQAEIYELPG